MQIIDKTINRVIKWDSEDISIPEMVDIIETEILEKASKEDLTKLEKGMYKTWVLGIGGGSRFRYFPSRISPVRLCCQFNVLTHSIEQITLLDTEKKVEYFIPSGKENCKKLQRAVLRRIEQYKDTETEDGWGSRRGGRFLNQKKSSNPMKWIGRGALGVAVAAAILVAAVNIPPVSEFLVGIFSDTPEWVPTVQNGYLGEFTDVTVYELLGNYRTFYENEVWDGGTTDDGDRIAEVRFSDSQSSGSATIQFRMLNDEVFKVSAYVDTTMPDAKSSDILYMLNLMYYSEAAMNSLGDDVKTEQLLALMRRVDANEVSYGAAAGYSGDRAALYRMGNDSLMGLTAAELLEYYGTPLIDTDSADLVDNTLPTAATTETTSLDIPNEELEYFSVDELLEDLNNDALRAKVKYMDRVILLTGKLDGFSDDGKTFTLRNVVYDFPQTINCTIPKSVQASGLALANYGDYITIQCQVTQAEQNSGYRVQTLDIVEITEDSGDYQEETAEALTGTVSWSAGELKVRSGPGTNYSEIRRLSPGTVVTISEQENVNGRYWGKISDGWVCMDYIDIGAQQSQPTGSSSTSVNMTVCVKLSAGELRIRSGPDSRYNEVGRLIGGEIVTVTELQQNGNKQWGRIPQGWICMDYVDTQIGSGQEQNVAERFVGQWGDQYSKRCFLTIEPIDHGYYGINIKWGSSAFSTSLWSAVGEYDATADCIRYFNCKHWDSESDGNGNFADNYYYRDGQGMFYFSGENLIWQDYQENVGYQCSFVKGG